MALQDHDTNSGEGRFERDARKTLSSVRDAFARILDATNANPENPQGVARRIGLDKSLAWKVSKIVQNSDPETTLQHLPGSGGIQIFLRSAKKAGAPEEALDAARTAVAEYEAMVQLHAGDRATLEMMISNLSSETSPVRDEAHRKLLYQGTSYLSGVQADIVTATSLLAPGDEGVDHIGLAGIGGLRRLRTDTPGVVRLSGGSVRVIGRDTVEPQALTARDVRSAEVPLLADHCSSPLPRILRDGAHGSNFRVVAGDVGRTAAAKVTIGCVQRSLAKSGEDCELVHRVSIGVPACWLVLDLLVHVDVDVDASVSMLLADSLEDESPLELPMSQGFEELGDSSSSLGLSELPGYAEQVEDACRLTGWNLDDFSRRRLRVHYPAVGMAYSARLELRS